MTFLDLVKTSLRTTTTDAKLEGQIKVDMQTALRELSLSGVHSSWLSISTDTETDTIDPVIMTCVSSYVCMMYPNDSINRAEWKSIWKLHSDMIHMRDEYTEEKPAV